MRLLLTFSDKETLLALSGLLINLSAGWLLAIPLVPKLTDINFWIILTTNLPAAIFSIAIAIWLSKKAQNI